MRSESRLTASTAPAPWSGNALLLTALALVLAGVLSTAAQASPNDPIAAFATPAAAPVATPDRNGTPPAQPASLAPQTTTVEPVPAAETQTDPVLRFLGDRGLLNTRPATDFAQQVKSSASDLAAELVISAMDFLGVRYQRGGQSRDTGFDCSGFTRHVFEHSVGMVLPRRAAEQAQMPGLLNVNQAELKPGDLVFFNTLRRTFSHVGIYVGDNKFIHSPRAGGAVRIEDMRLAYWQKRFDGARRAPQLGRSALSSTHTLQRDTP